MSTSTPEMIEAGMAALSALLEGAADRIEELEAEKAEAVQAERQRILDALGGGTYDLADSAYAWLCAVVNDSPTEDTP